MSIDNATILAEIEAGKTTYCLAGARDGSAFLEAHVLPENGMAFRPYGGDENAQWIWMDDDNFNKDYLMFEIIDQTEIENILSVAAEAMNKAKQTALKWKRIYNIALSCMGKKSKAKLGNLIISSLAVSPEEQE